MTWSHLNSPPLFDGKNGCVCPLPKRRKVAIVCNHPLTKYDAPLDDPTWEVWSLNSVLPIDSAGAIRADRWFELHPLEAQTKAEMQFLEELRVPVYMFDVYPTIPCSVRYPMERIEQHFGVQPGGPGDFFSCTMAYQIALAIMEGFLAIGLYGVELDRGSDRERTVERAAVCYWLGVARGMGIQVVIPEASTLLQHPVRYGYDYDGEIAWTNRHLFELVEYWQEEVQDGNRSLVPKGLH